MPAIARYVPSGVQGALLQFVVLPAIAGYVPSGVQGPLLQRDHSRKNSPRFKNDPA